MLIREVTRKDLEIVSYLNDLQTDFKLNNLDGCIIERIVFDGNVPVAYGIVKRMAEAIMLVNPHAARLLRAKAMRELMKYAEVGAKREHCNQLHCFVKDPKLAHSLEKQFGFVQSGDMCVVKEL